MALDELTHEYTETVIAIQENRRDAWWFITDHEDCPTASFIKNRRSRERQQWWKWDETLQTYAAYGECPSCRQRYKMIIARHVLMEMRLTGTAC